MCLALFFAIDKLEHYMQAYTVRLIAKADLIKYVIWQFLDPLNNWLNLGN